MPQIAFPVPGRLGQWMTHKEGLAYLTSLELGTLLEHRKVLLDGNELWIALVRFVFSRKDSWKLLNAKND